MTIKEKHCIIYKKALEYLWAHTEGLTQEILDTYLVASRKKTLNEVFEVAVYSFHDWNPQFGKSGIAEHKEKINELFDDFDVNKFLQKISALSDDELDMCFKDAFGGSNNAYQKVKENVYDSARYLSGFKSVDDMYAYFDSFDSTKQEGRDNLVKMIAPLIKWWGAALVANWLKDIGMSNFSKPDKHVKYIIIELGLSRDDDYEVMGAVFKIAEDYKTIDNTASAFKLDRILWLIGSGNFYNHKGLVKYNGNAKEFVDIVKSALTP